MQPAAETRFLAGYLLSGPQGRAAACKVDDTIRRLPGFEGIQLLEAWLVREVLGDRPHSPSVTALHASVQAGS